MIMTEKIDPLLLSVPMPILTPRLRIEAVNPRYTEVSVDSMKESKKEIGAWSAWINTPDALTLSARERWLRDHEAAFIRREKLYMLAFERTTDRLIGGTGFHNIDWDIPCFEIGYWVRTSATGQGYATEITIALMRYAFLALQARRVSAQHADGNDASARVITKSAMLFEGIARNDHLHVDGRVGDSYIYAATDIAQAPAMEVSWG
jgi:RimJ/RimL family protein N-acetyltransferase